MACSSCGGKRIHGRRPNSSVLIGSIETPDNIYQVSVISNVNLPGYREGDVVYLRGDGVQALIDNNEILVHSIINR